MKKFSKLLSVTLSLALCGSMVMPAMAASFTDLQNAIDGNGGDELGKGRYGYAYNTETEKYGIEAWTTDDTRNVSLNEDVTGKEGESSIDVSDQNTAIDLNGYTVDGTEIGDSVITVTDASLTLNGADEEGNKGTITGGSAVEGGGLYIAGSDVIMENVIISGNHAEYNGGGIYIGSTYDDDDVPKKSTVALNGVEIKDNSAGVAPEDWNGDPPEDLTEEEREYWWPDQSYGGGIFILGSSASLKDVTIEGNTASNGGGGFYSDNSAAAFENVDVIGNKAGYAGGVEVNRGSSIKVNGGEISGNKAVGTGDDWSEYTGNGGGMIVENHSTATINNTKFIGNTSNHAGGALNIYDRWEGWHTSVTINNGTFQDNKAGTCGGGIAASTEDSVVTKNTNFTISASTIEGNSATDGGGICVWNGANGMVNGSSIFNNTAKNSGDDIAGMSGATLTMAGDQSVGQTLKDDGKAITGWYVDNAGSRWSDGNYDEADISALPGDFALKAAHGVGTPGPGPDPVEPGPGPGPNPTPTPDPDPEDPPVDIDEPDVPLGELPDDEIEIDEVEIPLEELPEIEIDEPDVPLDGTPQTGDTSVTALWAMMFAVSLAGAAILFTRKERNA